MSLNTDVKLFAHAVLRFLKGQLESQTLSSDAAESLEVAVQCLQNAYSLEDSNEESGEGTAAKHIDLFELFCNSALNVSQDRKSAAEALKNEGNHLMKLEKYHEALTYYNRAINMDATNPVFYCNRAAAYSKIGELQKAIDDCKMSLRYDPNYSKAHGRLGLAYSKLNRYDEAIQAYENALKIEPNNVDYQNNLRVTRERLYEEKMTGSSTQSGASAPPNPGGLPRGMPDLLSYMNNPEMVNLAMNMLSQPAVRDTVMAQLSGAESYSDILERGRNLTAEFERSYPEIFESMRATINEIQVNSGSNDTNNTPGTENDKKSE